MRLIGIHCIDVRVCVRTRSGKVLVNRGFVPMSKKSPESRPAGQIEGEVLVEGIVRTQEKVCMCVRVSDMVDFGAQSVSQEQVSHCSFFCPCVVQVNAYTPDNRPDDNQWFWRDLNDMAAYTGSDPIYIDACLGKQGGQRVLCVR